MSSTSRSRFRVTLVGAAALLVGMAVESTSIVATAFAQEVRVVRPDGQARAVAETRLWPTRTPPLVANDGTTRLDGVRFELMGLAKGASQLRLVSRNSSGEQLDSLVVPLATRHCEGAPTRSCMTSPMLRMVTDRTDRTHPLATSSSLLVELGGEVSMRTEERELARLSVEGPPLVAGYASSHRAKVRVVLVRAWPGGALPFGRDPASARAAARDIVRSAGAIWASCGLALGERDDLLVEVADPPTSHLVAVGCESGLPATGGEVGLAVDGVSVRARIDAGMTPREAARKLAKAIRAAGFAATVSDNPRSTSAALPTSDVLVRRLGGELAELSPLPTAAGDPGFEPVSTDASLDACIGTVELGDGLQHFDDGDSAAGTLEERTLLKALDDHDPTTLDVYVVPGFSRGGRIGESFISSDRGAIGNAIVFDRASLAGGRAHLTLAHEIGHVLLDDPGHPDDFIADAPSALMDSDATDTGAFGARRLSLEECRRALLQSGPQAPVRLLVPR